MSFVSHLFSFFERLRLKPFQPMNKRFFRCLDLLRALTSSKAKWFFDLKPEEKNAHVYHNGLWMSSGSKWRRDGKADDPCGRGHKIYLFLFAKGVPICVVFCMVLSCFVYKLVKVCSRYILSAVYCNRAFELHGCSIHGRMPRRMPCWWSNMMTEEEMLMPCRTPMMTRWSTLNSNGVKENTLWTLPSAKQNGTLRTVTPLWREDFGMSGRLCKIVLDHIVGKH